MNSVGSGIGRIARKMDTVGTMDGSPFVHQVDCGHFCGPPIRYRS